MSLRFSNEGPAFPEQLVDALLTGDVVFLCGAGISAPQLPLFSGLVEECVGRLGLEKNASETESFKNYRFEEVLGSLSRRTVDPGDVIRAVVNILRERSENADLAHHHTILRLSRSLDNRPTVITTNFDTMLEKALWDVEGIEQAQELSFAGQDLPSPGSTEFGGIIHLHGRIADERIGLKQTPLVVTSADYGDAYMRSGWASRFLFDLCRCKTVVLVGYSAGDAPVRYFLNVLEADRQRFPDVLPVYALDGVKARELPDARWSTLAVEPIAYEFTTDAANGNEDHSALWRDLDQLAELVVRPRTTRHAWAQTILVKSFDAADLAERDRILWLLQGRRDLWPVAIRSIEDVAWFNFLVERKVWSDQDVAWILAAWIARNLQSVDRFRGAIQWLERFGKPFSDALIRHVDQSKDLPDLWLRAWRLLAASQPRFSKDLDLHFYAMLKILRGSVVLNKDLHHAVGLITPVFKLTARELAEGDSPNRLADIFGARWIVRGQGEATELVDALVEVPQSHVIIAIATAKLQEVVGVTVDLDAIDEYFDKNDYSVPSVEPHTQNDHHEGPVFLVQLLARLLPAATQLDKATTRSLVTTWRKMSGFLGCRLWLHALRNKALFTGDEAIAGLADLPLNVFWHVRRELALVLRDRAADADEKLVAQVEQRILIEGKAYYEHYTIEDGQADWRGHARDSEVWLRLNMLNIAGMLSRRGATELASIKRTREYLDRDVEERDFFGSYSYGVQEVVGDAQPIIDAGDGERLEVARQVIHSPDIRKQLGWSVYCRTDPSGAFDTLAQAELDASNAPLWNTLIGSLSFAQEAPDEHRSKLVISIFEVIKPANGTFLELIIDRLADLYFRTPRQSALALADWWPRLFAIAVDHDIEPFDASCELAEDAINSPAGRLTQALLADVERCRQQRELTRPDLLKNIAHAASTEGRQGIFARAVLIRDAAFVLSIDGQTVAGLIDAALTGESAEAAALRSVLVNRANLSSTTSRVFCKHILQGVTEIGGRDRSSRTAAAKIMAPALSIIRREQDADHWGISLEQTDLALKKGPPALREGAVRLLVQWIHEIEGGPAEAWRTSIGPLLARWSRDRELYEKELTQHFAELAIASADAFPEALNQLLPYLTQLHGRGSLYAIESSEAPEKFPSETLTLLWRLFGPGCTSNLFGVPKILERMIKAKPSIELDRRLQWLDQMALRYE
ncbi:SIR2 family protein [Pseudomonas sp. UBT]|uniref:SIR2 family protein n=1 Tax=Pseudomonas sp. UBT TaxID=3239198 RepID=UPI003D805E56